MSNYALYVVEHASYTNATSPHERNKRTLHGSNRVFGIHRLDTGGLQWYGIPIVQRHPPLGVALLRWGRTMMPKNVGRSKMVAALAAVAVLGALALIAPAGAAVHHSAGASQLRTVSSKYRTHWCNTNGVTCTEPYQNWDEFPKAFAYARSHGVELGRYIGHDEPSLLFYSSTAGSGNNNTYSLTVPKDPPVTPRQDGSGGTWNFQLHPAFWFGMAMCDDQSAPNPDGAAQDGHATVPCTSDSNKNIYTSTDPTNAKYLGRHPGSAFMEMQFYPPGWTAWPAGVSCDAKHWCAALNIDSLSINENSGNANNADCLNRAGIEPVNFAFVTNNGQATAPANPLDTGAQFVPDLSKDFLMSPGDSLKVQMFDTAAGFRVVIHDLTTSTVGSMTASTANGFGQVVFDPSASTCAVNLGPFHPEYNTSGPDTRVPWAAHSYNVAFADEIGHFEYCAKVNSNPLSSCAKPLGFDTNNPDNKGPAPSGDDVFCLPASSSTLIKIGGCLGTDGDFDGVPYDHTWPGSISSPTADGLLNPAPIRFTSPTTGAGSQFSQAAFEADLPRIESADTAFDVTQPCQRFITNPADPHPGQGCVNPPPHSRFYPFFSAATSPTGGHCQWQLGGPYIPGTTSMFGGSSQAEFGSLLVLAYPTSPFGTVTTRYNDFRKILSSNPCIG